MSIIFEPFTPVKVTYLASLAGDLPLVMLRNRALDVELPKIVSEILAEVQIGPQVSGVIAALPLIQGEIKAGYRQLATLDKELPLMRSLLSFSETTLIGELPLLQGALSHRAPVTVGIVLPGLRATMVLEFDADNYVSEFVAADQVTMDPVILLQSMMAFVDTPSYIGDLRMTLDSSFNAQAAFTYVFQYEHQDSILATDQLDVAFELIMVLADELMLSDETLSQTNALLTIVSAMVLNDLVKFGQDLTFESTAEFTDEFEAQLLLIMSLLSEYIAEDEVTYGAAFVATLESELIVSVDQTWTAAAMIELLDTADFSVRLRLPGFDGGLFTGYAMNLRNAGTTRYDNFPFVDFAVVGGVPLGAGPDGLYDLNGDTDDGEPIAARVRTGLTNFGSPLLKHVLNAWVGYTTDGVLVLKTVTENKQGNRQENWYQLTPRDTTMPVENRFSIAKGLTSVYWGFEITNLDGADFELDAIRVWPLAVQRRQSGR